MKVRSIPDISKICPNSPAALSPERGPLISGGLSRLDDFKSYLPFGRETWRLLVLAGRAPQPIRMGARCTVWRNDEVNAWLASPATFMVGE